MLLGIDGVYIDPTEICALYPPELGVECCTTVLMKNGHKIDVDVSSHVMARQVVKCCKLADAMAKGLMLHPNDMLHEINEVESTV